MHKNRSYAQNVNIIMLLHHSVVQQISPHFTPCFNQVECSQNNPAAETRTRTQSRNVKIAINRRRSRENESVLARVLKQCSLCRHAIDITLAHDHDDRSLLFLDHLLLLVIFTPKQAQTNWCMAIVKTSQLPPRLTPADSICEYSTIHSKI